MPKVYSLFTSYLSVTVSSDETNGFLIDESTQNANQRYSVPLLNYTVVVFNISVGYHTLKHTNANVKFAAIVYGRLTYMGYGFHIGIQLSG